MDPLKPFQGPKSPVEAPWGPYKLKNVKIQIEKISA